MSVGCFESRKFSDATTLDIGAKKDQEGPNA